MPQKLKEILEGIVNEHLAETLSELSSVTAVSAASLLKNLRVPVYLKIQVHTDL